MALHVLAHLHGAWLCGRADMNRKSLCVAQPTQWITCCPTGHKPIQPTVLFKVSRNILKQLAQGEVPRILLRQFDLLGNQHYCLLFAIWHTVYGRILHHLQHHINISIGLLVLVYFIHLKFKRVHFMMGDFTCHFFFPSFILQTGYVRLSRQASFPVQLFNLSLPVTVTGTLTL